MQPQLAPQIVAATRRQFPDGIPAYGTDALRFTFCSLATQGRDIRFDLGRIEGYGNFCNKLWNAARFVLINTEGKDCGLDGAEVELGLPERWIRSLLQRTEAQVRSAMERYRLDLAAQAIYDFTWNEYCDWYLELSKTVLANQGAAEGAIGTWKTPGPNGGSSGAIPNRARLRGTRRTLVRVLEAVLRLMHPLMPFVTEEIWQRVAPLAGRSGPSIMLEPYPAPRPELDDPDAVEHMTWLKDLVLAIRRIRGELDLPPSRQIPVVLVGPSDAERERLAGGAAYVRALARVLTIDILQDGDPTPKASTALLGELEILVPLEGIIDKDAEIGRLVRELDKLGKNLHRSRAKLDNASFRDRAPAEVVEKERGRAAEFESSIGKLEAQLETLHSL